MKADQTTESVVAVAQQAQPLQPFRQLLEQAAHDAKEVPLARVSGAPSPPPLPLPRLRPGAAIAAGSTPLARITLTSAAAADVARVARGRVETEAHRLADVRDESHAQASEAVASRSADLTNLKLHRKERLVELITRELVAAFDDGGSAAANDLPSKTPTPQSYPANASPDAAAAQPSPAELKKASGDRAAQAVALIERIEFFVRAAKRPALELTLNNSLGARVEIERLGPGEVAIKLVGQRGPPSPDTVSRIRDELRARGLKVAAMSVA